MSKKLGVLLLIVSLGLSITVSAAAQERKCITLDEEAAQAQAHGAVLFAEFDDIITPTNVHVSHLRIYQIADGEFFLVGFEEGCVYGWQQTTQAGVDQLLRKIADDKRGI